MSYDVTIGEFTRNYTSNGSEIFYNHMDGGIPALHGLTGNEAGNKISMWIDSFGAEMMSLWDGGAVGEPKLAALYDSKNGWGSTIHAIIFLMSILDACRKNPRNKVDVSY